MTKVTCSNCKYYNAAEGLCDLNYRAMCIADEKKSAQSCDFFTDGPYIDSDENLLLNQ